MFSKLKNWKCLHVQACYSTFQGSLLSWSSSLDLKIHLCKYVARYKQLHSNSTCIVFRIAWHRYQNSLFLASHNKKICFSRISQEISVLEHKLLHELYINMVITNILVYSKSLYDFRNPKYEKCNKRKWLGNGRGHMGVMLNFSELSPGLNLFFRPLRTSVQSYRVVPSAKMWLWHQYQNSSFLASRDQKNQFFENISGSKHFGAYVASWVVYKHGHCEHFGVFKKSLRPS